MSLVYGIDISNWQSGREVALAREHRASHVVVRASHEWPQLIEIARAQMMALGVSGHSISPYPWCDWPRDPVEQMDLVLNEYSHYQRPNALWWLDCEQTEGLDASNPGVLHQWLARAVDYLERAGWRAGIYTRANWWQEWAGNTDAFSRLPLWLAHYDGIPGLESTTLPFGGWTECQGKQYAEVPIDLDVFARDTLWPPSAPDYSALQERIDRAGAMLDLELARPRLRKAPVRSARAALML